MSDAKPVRQEPKNKRASAPKVRTGCVTWYVLIRHLKCDEGKPTCKRCHTGKDGKVNCSGYLPIRNKRPAQHKSAVAQTHTKNDSHPAFSLVPGYLNPDCLRDDVGAAFFHHFRTSTIDDLVLFPHSAGFWELHVLPLANAIPAVRYATTALGTAHRAFLLEPYNLSATGEKQRLEFLATAQYNKTIRQLLPHVSSGGPMNIRIIVTCCLLFYCLENIRGCSNESIQHLKAGSRLLLSLPQHSITEPVSSDTGSDDAIRDISHLFARLGVEASLYSEDEVVPDLSSFRASVSPLDYPMQPFLNLTVARNTLSDIDIDLGTYNNKGFILMQKSRSDESMDGGFHPLNSADGHNRSTIISPDGLIHGPPYELELRPIIDRFRCWRRRFSKTVAEAEKSRLKQRDRQEIMMLELRKRVWETMLEETPDGDPKQADSILDQAELVVQSFSSKHPIFTLESNVMSSTSFICAYSNEERHRRRALDILRSARMREGVWDSGWLADQIEAHFPELKLRTAWTAPCTGPSA
ncbi:hypothetical protein GQ53DRAFT_864104 [Thozetella sp. PMI_491]|nr:hypothetical protein GQ53DRAFT_864104 [Thozetella sp. PMI_491]